MRFIIFLVLIVYFNLSFGQSKDAESIEVRVSQSDGLGMIVRKIGLNPDWRNLKWVEIIRNRNPDLVDSNGFLTRPDGILFVPIEVTQLLSPLPNEIETIKSDGKTPAEAAIPPSATKIETTTLQEITRPSANNQPISKSKFDLSFEDRMIKIMASLSQTEVTANDVDFFDKINSVPRPSPELRLEVCSNCNIQPGLLGSVNSVLVPHLYLAWQYTDFVNPNGINFVQKDLNYYDFGFGLGWSHSAFFYSYGQIVLQYRSFIKFTGTDAIIENKFGPGIRIGLKYTFWQGSHWGSSLGGSYTYLLGRSASEYKIRPGDDFAVRGDIQHSSGFGVEFSYGIGTQDTSLTEHKYEKKQVSGFYSF